MRRGRELYREGTPENIKKGYTDLVYGGDNVSVEKGVISAEGSGGGGGGLTLYGPYYAGLPEDKTISANSSDTIYFDKFATDKGIQELVDYPDTNAILIPAEVFLQYPITDLETPIFQNGSWYLGWKVGVYNYSANQQTIYAPDGASVTFYSTVEFPPAGE